MNDDTCNDLVEEHNDEGLEEGQCLVEVVEEASVYVLASDHQDVGRIVPGSVDKMTVNRAVILMKNLMVILMQELMVILKKYLKKYLLLENVLVERKEMLKVVKMRH